MLAEWLHSMFGLFVITLITGSAQTRLQRNIQPQRGPVCFDCPVLDHPKSCPHLTICNIGQVCMLREMRDYTTGTLKFHATCEDPLVCARFGGLTGTQQTVGCLTCCYLDFCNDQCNTHTVTQVVTTLSTLPANVGHGLYCYNCRDMAAPNSCPTFTLCGIDQVCMIRDIFVSTNNQQFQYAASCESKKVCEALDRVAPSNRCHTCCSTDFCNDKCTRVPTHTSSAMEVTTRKLTTVPPQPISVIATATDSSTIANVGRVCYSCNAVEDISKCLNIAQCNVGQICMLSELAPDQLGRIKYTASCENKQVCEALLSLHTGTSKPACHSCCDVDLCNRNCGREQVSTTSFTERSTSPKVDLETTTLQTNPTRSPDGSLKCYECANMATADDCSNQITCEQDKVCMIRDVPFPVSGMREFSASCVSKQVCDVLNSLQNKCNTLCHRCCNTTLCNNHCN